MNRLRRVGHKGADLIAPGNTYASFDAALEAGVDMIEFDVLPERGSGRLILAHDHRDAARREPHTLDEGLAHLASAPFAGIELDVDLKLPGYELAGRRGPAGPWRARALADLKPVPVEPAGRSGRQSPDVRLGWSVPKLRRDPFRSRRTAGPGAGGLWSSCA